jgi:predicted metalloprotease
MGRRLALALAMVALLLLPATVRAQSSAEEIAAAVDAWWAEELAARGIPYSSPRLELVTAPGMDFCAFIDTYAVPAGYCAPNQTITISTAFVSPEAVVGLLPLISHEWGHHIQGLTDTGIASPLEAELQADCFAGAFTAFAADADWISPVVAALALQLTQSAGDIWWLAPADEAIHGTGAERAVAFMTGQSGGLEACGL